MKLNKIPITKLEEMVYKDLDSKRAVIDYFIAERLNEIIDDLQEIKRRVEELDPQSEHEEWCAEKDKPKNHLCTKIQSECKHNWCICEICDGKDYGHKVCLDCKAIGVSSTQASESNQHDTMSEPTQDSWEERFYEEFCHSHSNDPIHLDSGATAEDIKDFISNELLKQRQEIIEEIKEYKHEFINSDYFDSCIPDFVDDLLERLEKK
jgi:hypothetical protein